MLADSALPSSLQTWYLACRSAEVPAGKVVSVEIAGQSVVVFRGKSGGVRALAAHCSHMGAHLGKGSVVGDCIRCPLHHREFDGGGVCRLVPGMDAIPAGAKQRVFPVEERYGAVFVFNGPKPLFELPALGNEGRSLYVRSCQPVRLRCPWYAVVANGFDVEHLEVVHKRALREEPVVERLDDYRLRLRYVSRVTGGSAADRSMRWLSGDRIEVSITCWGGSIVTVESVLGRVRGTLLLGVTPDGEDTEVTLFVGVSRTGVAAIDATRARVADWLYSGFLRRDVAILEGMRFHTAADGPRDAAVRRCLDYLGALPRG